MSNCCHAPVDDYGRCTECQEMCEVVGQPSPIPNDSTPIWELVIADMQERNKTGIARYGTPLQAHNGRDALRDAYEEALDLAVYLRQALEEDETEAR